MADHTQLAVLGGGPGGYAAAFLAADLGMQVTLIERDDRLGGACLLRGCIPSKALLHVAKVMHEVDDLAHWGVAFARPSIELAAMRARKDKVITKLASGLSQLAKRRKVRVVHARGTFADSQTLRLESGPPENRQSETLAYDHCILAVGSRPSVLPALDLASDRVMDSTTALELPDLPGSLLVIGGGYIGLEMGTVYAELGTRVTVVELTDGLLPGVDRDLVKPLEDRLKKSFTAIRLGARVTALKDRGGSVEAVIESEAGPLSETFDRVLVAVGRRPNSDDIGLERTNVLVDSGGFVTVDEQQRTADPHILAVGDVAGEPMLAHKASHEGKVAVEALHGGPAAFDPLAIPAVVFTDPEVAWAGLTEEQARSQQRGVTTARFPWGASGRAQTLGRTEGLTKLVIEPQSEQVLGVGLVGPGAGELIAEGVLAIEMGCTVRDITETIHAHPTLSETYGGAGDVHFGLATELYRPRRERSATR